MPHLHLERDRNVGAGKPGCGITSIAVVGQLSTRVRQAPAEPVFVACVMAEDEPLGLAGAGTVGQLAEALGSYALDPLQILPAVRGHERGLRHQR